VRPACFTSAHGVHDLVGRLLACASALHDSHGVKAAVRCNATAPRTPGIAVVHAALPASPTSALLMLLLLPLGVVLSYTLRAGIAKT
jgi:hypothetical protein